MRYFVDAQDWASGRSPDDPTDEEVLAALDGLEFYLEPAMDGLMRTADEGLRRLEESEEVPSGD